MKRVLLIIASSISFLLCIAVAALWARNPESVDKWECTTRNRVHWEMLSLDRVIISRVSGWPESPGVRHYILTRLDERHPVRFPPDYSEAFSIEHFPTGWRLGGFDFRRGSLSVALDRQGHLVRGLSSKDLHMSPGRPFWEIQIPFWTAVPLAILPVVTAFLCIRRLVIRLRRWRFSQCIVCGYSLTGNTSGVCPECGTPVQKTHADKSPQPV